MTVAEILEAVSRLSPEELAEVRAVVAALTETQADEARQTGVTHGLFDHEVEEAQEFLHHRFAQA